MTSPVVFMPLNQDLIDANLTVEQLQIMSWRFSCNHLPFLPNPPQWLIQRFLNG